MSDSKPAAAPQPIKPPFTLATATAKVRGAEDAWNSRNPERVALAYSEDSRWRNRAEILTGRAAIREFLRRKWARELDYRLIKEIWAKYHWPAPAARPKDHPGLSDLGL